MGTSIVNNKSNELYFRLQTSFVRRFYKRGAMKIASQIKNN